MSSTIGKYTPEEGQRTRLSESTCDIVNRFKYISLECEGLSDLNFFGIICQHLDKIDTWHHRNHSCHIWGKNLLQDNFHIFKRVLSSPSSCIWGPTASSIIMTMTTDAGCLPDPPAPAWCRDGSGWGDAIILVHFSSLPLLLSSSLPKSSNTINNNSNSIMIVMMMIITITSQLREGRGSRLTKQTRCGRCGLVQLRAGFRSRHFSTFTGRFSCYQSLSFVLIAIRMNICTMFF